jgi:hypothetical protein
MQLFHASVFQGQEIEVREGWDFFKGSLEIKNPDGSTSLFGQIKNSTNEESVRLYDGYLNNNRPHFLEKDLRKDETSDYFLLTMASDDYIDISRSFAGKKGYTRIGPKRKEDKSLVLITLCLQKDENFLITVKKPSDGKIREIAIRFSGLLGTLLLEDVTPKIKKPTLTLRAVRFLKKIIYKKSGFFGHF